MRDIVVFIQVPLYLEEWLVHSFGSPVRFPRRSYENILLTNLLQKKTIARQPKAQNHHGLAVVIPRRSGKKPEYYNYLSENAEHRLVRQLKNVFKLHLWSDIFPLVNSGAPLNESINTWCQGQGISVENREAVRQCFFRLRQNHEEYGIVLGKKYVKSLPL